MFNIVAQLQASGITGLSNVKSQIERELRGALNPQISVSVNPSSIGSVTSLTRQVQQLKNDVSGLSQSGINISTSSAAPLTNISRSLNEVASASVKTNREIKNVSEGFNTATSSAENFGKAAGLAARRYSAFLVSGGAILGVVQGIKSATNEALQFERELVRLNQVGAGTADQIKAIENEITRLSTNLGVSSLELAKSANVLAQAGLNARETAKALEALAQASLSPNFGNMGDTVEGVIAIMQQFKLEAGEIQGALSSVNAVASAFAVESRDLIEAVKRSGGAFRSTGGDLNEFLALFTSVRSTTRESADSIATGLRTIFARLQRNDTVDALRDLGVNLRYSRDEALALNNVNLTDQFVGAFEAVKRLNSALRDVPTTDPRYSAVIEQLGGYRQISRVLPLIQELSTSQRAYNVALFGTNSLQVAAGQAQESTIVKVEKLRQQFLALFRTITESQGFKSLIDLTSTLAGGLGAVLENLTPLLPLFAKFAAIRLGVSVGRELGGFFGVNNQRGIISGLGAGLSGQPIRRNGGGIVPGFGDTDSVPAMLTPGEYVIRKDAVKAIGLDNLMAMNGYNTGGLVQRFVEGGRARRISQSRAEYFRSLIEANGGVSGTPESNALNKLITQETGLTGRDITEFRIALGEDKFKLARETKTRGNDQLLLPFDNDKIGILTAGRVAESGLRFVTDPYTGEKTSKEVQAKFAAKGIKGIYGGVTSHILSASAASQFRNQYDLRINPALSTLFPSGSGIQANLDTAQRKTVAGYIFESFIGALSGLNPGRGDETFDYPGNFTTGRRSGYLNQYIYPKVETGELLDLKYVDEGSKRNKSALKKYVSYANSTGQLDKALLRRNTGGGVPGTGTVPALLTPGEFVFSAEAANAIGLDKLDQMNRQRFAKGGLVRVGLSGTPVGLAGRTGSPDLAEGQTDLLSVKKTGRSAKIDEIERQGYDLSKVLVDYRVERASLSGENKFDKNYTPLVQDFINNQLFKGLPLVDGKRPEITKQGLKTALGPIFEVYLSRLTGQKVSESNAGFDFKQTDPNAFNKIFNRGDLTARYIDAKPNTGLQNVRSVIRKAINTGIYGFKGEGGDNQNKINNTKKLNAGGPVGSVRRYAGGSPGGVRPLPLVSDENLPKIYINSRGSSVNRFVPNFADRTSIPLVSDFDVPGGKLKINQSKLGDEFSNPDPSRNNKITNLSGLFDELRKLGVSIQNANKHVIEMGGAATRAGKGFYDAKVAIEVTANGIRTQLVKNKDTFSISAGDFAGGSVPRTSVLPAGTPIGTFPTEGPRKPSDPRTSFVDPTNQRVESSFYKSEQAKELARQNAAKTFPGGPKLNRIKIEDVYQEALNQGNSEKQARTLQRLAYRQAGNSGLDPTRAAESQFTLDGRRLTRFDPTQTPESGFLSRAKDSLKLKLDNSGLTRFENSQLLNFTRSQPFTRLGDRLYGERGDDKTEEGRALNDRRQARKDLILNRAQIAGGFATTFVADKLQETVGKPTAGALSGAGEGLAIGATFGPKGAIAGLAIGAIYGYIDANNQAAKELRQNTINKNLTELGDRLGKLTDGVIDANDAFKSVNQINETQRLISQKAVTDNTGFFGGLDSKKYADQVQRETRESFSSLSPALASILGKVFDDAAKNGSSFTDVSKSIRDGNSPNSVFARRLAGNEGKSVDQVLEQFRKGFVSTQRDQSLQQARDRVNIENEKLFGSFTRLGQVLEKTSDVMVAAYDKLQLIESGVEGRINVGFNGTLSNNIKGNARGITGIFGQEGVDFAKSIESVESLKTVLPDVLSRTLQNTGALDSESIGEKLAKNLRIVLGEGGQIDQFIRATVTNFKGLKPEEVSRGRSDVGKLSDDLIKDLAPISEAARNIAKKLEANAAEYAGALTKYANLQNQANDELGKLDEIVLNVTRVRAGLTGRNTGIADLENQLPLNILNRPFEQNQLRLAGGLSVEDIGRRINQLRGGELQVAGAAAQNEIRNGGIAGEATKNFVNLQNEANNLTKALRNLATDTTRVSNIQQKLAQIQGQREARGNYIENFLTADPQERFQLLRRQQLVGVAAAQNGNIGNFDQESLRELFKGLREIGNIKLPGLGGRTGNDIRQLVLDRNGSLNGGEEKERADLERQLIDTLEQQRKAQELYANTVKTAGDQFLEGITKAQDTFVQEMNKTRALEEGRRKLIERTDTQGKLEAAQKGDTFRSTLANQGITAENGLYGKLRLGESARASAELAASAGTRIEGFDQTIAEIEKRGKKSQLKGSSVEDIGNELSRLGIDNNPQLVADIRKKFEESRIRNSGVFADQNSPQTKAAFLQASQIPIPALRNKVFEYIVSQSQLTNPEQYKKETENIVRISASDYVKSQRQLAVQDQNRARESLEESGFDKNQRTFIEQQFRNSEFVKTLDATSADSLNNFSAEVQKATARLKELGGPIVAQTRAAGGPIVPNLPKGIFGSKGTDTVSALLTPGEYVVNRRQTDANKDLLHKINNGNGPLTLADGGQIPEEVFRIVGNNRYSGARLPFNDRDAEVAQRRKDDALAKSQRQEREKVAAANRGSAKVDPLTGAKYQYAYSILFDRYRKELANTDDRLPETRERKAALVREINEFQQALRTNNADSMNLIMGRLTEEERFSVDTQSGRGAGLERQFAAATDNQFKTNYINLIRTVNVQKSVLTNRLRYIDSYLRNPNVARNPALVEQGNQQVSQIKDYIERVSNYPSNVSDVYSGKINRQVMAAVFRDYNGLTRYVSNKDVDKLVPQGFAFGGVVPGTGNTDSVRALLTPGEFVVNKTAARAIGYDNLAAVQKFAEGGRVGASTPAIDLSGISGLAPALTGFAEPAQLLSSALTGFNNVVGTLVDGLGKIPQSISLEGVHQHVITVTGLENFANIEPVIKQMAEAIVTTKLNEFVRTKFPEVNG